MLFVPGRPEDIFHQLWRHRRLKSEMIFLQGNVTAVGHRLRGGGQQDGPKHLIFAEFVKEVGSPALGPCAYLIHEPAQVFRPHRKYHLAAGR